MTSALNVLSVLHCTVIVWPQIPFLCDWRAYMSVPLHWRTSVGLIPRHVTSHLACESTRLNFYLIWFDLIWHVLPCHQSSIQNITTPPRPISCYPSAFIFSHPFSLSSLSALLLLLSNRNWPVPWAERGGRLRQRSLHTGGSLQRSVRSRCADSEGHFYQHEH